MAKGWDRVENAAQESAENRERWAAEAANRKPELFVKQGESVVVRFLEQGPDINNFAVHEYQVQTAQGPRRRTFTCLNDKDDGTPCPACAAGMKRKLKGVYNVIQRQRPILRRGQDGKALKDGNNNYIVDGYADAVVILTVPSTTAEVLRQKDAHYQGLMSRDILASKTGSQFQPWNFEPADINSPAAALSEADLVLLGSKHNLDEFMAPPTFQEAAQTVAKYGNQPAQGGGQPVAAPGPQGQPGAGNQFLVGGAPPAGAPANTFGTAQPPTQAQPPVPAQPVAPPPAPAPVAPPAPAEGTFPPAGAPVPAQPAAPAVPAQ